jgi:diacylglycerol kinase (ATP)
MAQFFVNVAKSFGYAGRGVVVASRGRNFRIMIAVALVVVTLGAILDVSRTSWGILLICIGGVLGAEGMNTAIEKLADQIETRYHSAIGDIKDVAAGAVLVGSVLAAIVGLIVFWPYVTG